jgi:hypothetical protein
MLAERLTPILNVSNFADSVTWFEKLGWRKGWDWGDPADFGAVISGDCEIFLCENCQGGRGKGQGVWIMVKVSDIDSIHRECETAGVEILMRPTDVPWGLRELHVRHPDGHVLRMGERIQRRDVPDGVKACAGTDG